MVKEVSCQERGFIERRDGRYVVISAIVSHNGFVVSEQLWVAPFNANTAKIAQHIADDNEALQWKYQSMWTLGEMKDLGTHQIVKID